ncbi:TPA: hypothetical protein ACIZB4_002579 [Legionella pneumophila]|uniref:Uncharacterized protein n=1 Tax=Legionella pneumophila TaxID=446 RepID=A0A378K863_LEGPN|nr:hypothetical protein [Legionella pneumophila]ANH14081.1 hypothetical protein A5478_13965 [Legionella pneumophila]ANH17042.1 hypothetical protein A5480_13960 [Legionella pneumophila]ANH20019.1 hypothetical protein A5479_14000 [Legionella pneumophila]APX20902.1 hypothetical protein A1D14_13980 [Legionella pneumophila]AQL13079.1 hypothetical protein A1D13_13980 [Legionella pneumophila]
MTINDRIKKFFSKEIGGWHYKPILNPVGVLIYKSIARQDLRTYYLNGVLFKLESMLLSLPKEHIPSIP